MRLSVLCSRLMSNEGENYIHSNSPASKREGEAFRAILYSQKSHVSTD